MANPSAAQKTMADAHKSLAASKKKKEADTRKVIGAAGSAAPSKTGAGGKPSVTGHAAKGAAAGAVTGATLGSVVPGVGTAVGAAAGAVIGGGAGAVGGKKAKQAWKSNQAGAGDKRALIAEFLICTLVLALSPLGKPEGGTAPRDWMRRGTALCGLFVILGFIASVGPRAGRVAVALGGLITVVLAVDQRGIFKVIAERFGSNPSQAGDVGGPSDSGPVSTGPTVPMPLAEIPRDSTRWT